MTATAPLVQAGRPTDEELTARAHSLGEIISAGGPQGESDRRIPAGTIRALTESGLFRLGTPRRYGGYETSVKTMLDVCSAIGEYDGATAWVATLINVTTWAAALFGSAARDEVFGSDPDAKVSGVGSSAVAQVEQAEGGLRVSGRWYYNSGGLHSDWVMLGMLRTDENGTMVGHNSVLIPRGEVDIEETWFVAGMRGTGSNCVVADNVFVPEHRVANTLDFVEGRFLNDHADEEPLYRSAWQPVLALVLVGPQLGLARAAFRLVTSQADKRAISMTFYGKEQDSVGFQLQVARAKMMIESAHLHAYRAAADIDNAAAANEYPGNLLRSRIRADCGWAVEHLRDAIQLLIDANGAGSFAESNPLQRIWRDCSVGGHHALMNYTVNYEIYGKQLLGVDTPIVPTI